MGLPSHRPKHVSLPEAVSGSYQSAMADLLVDAGALEMSILVLDKKVMDRHTTAKHELERLREMAVWLAHALMPAVKKRPIPFLLSGLDKSLTMRVSGCMKDTPRTLARQRSVPRRSSRGRPAPPESQNRLSLSDDEVGSSAQSRKASRNVQRYNWHSFCKTSCGTKLLLYIISLYFLVILFRIPRHPFCS